MPLLSRSETSGAICFTCGAKHHTRRSGEVHKQSMSKHCSPLWKTLTRHNFYASFKVWVVQVEDAFCPHIWPSGILVEHSSMDSQQQKMLDWSTDNIGSEKWRTVCGCLQLPWLDFIVAWHWATLCYVSHSFSPRNLAGQADPRQADRHQW